MSTPWHLKPAALAIIAKMRRPAIKHTSQRYPLTVDHFHEYEGPEVDQLFALYGAELERRDAIVPYPTDRVVRADFLLGALFGDPASGGGYKTHWDTSDEWAAIRDEVNAALALECAA